MNVSRYRNKSSLFRDPVAPIFADPEEVRGQTKHGTRVHCKPVPLGPPVPALSRLHHVKGDLFSSPADEPLARLHHVKGDLFSSPADEPLAHCISEDCRMGAGIAVLFRKTFGGVAELKAQKKTPGQCAVLKRGRRWIYYLVTKKKASQKPTYDALRLSLEAMKVHCLENGVLSLSMPRIGCGLDRLKWEKVASMIEEVFRSTGVYVSVYTL